MFKLKWLDVPTSDRNMISKNVILPNSVYVNFGSAKKRVQVVIDEELPYNYFVIPV